MSDKRPIDINISSKPSNSREGRQDRKTFLEFRNREHSLFFDGGSSPAVLLPPAMNLILNNTLQHQENSFEVPGPSERILFTENAKHSFTSSESKGRHIDCVVEANNNKASSPFSKNTSNISKVAESSLRNNVTNFVSSSRKDPIAMNLTEGTQQQFTFQNELSPSSGPSNVHVYNAAQNAETNSKLPADCSKAVHFAESSNNVLSFPHRQPIDENRNNSLTDSSPVTLIESVFTKNSKNTKALLSNVKRKVPSVPICKANQAVASEASQEFRVNASEEQSYVSFPGTSTQSDLVHFSSKDNLVRDKVEVVTEGFSENKPVIHKVISDNSHSSKVSGYASQSLSEDNDHLLLGSQLNRMTLFSALGNRSSLFNNSGLKLSEVQSPREASVSSILAESGNVLAEKNSVSRNSRMSGVNVPRMAHGSLEQIDTNNGMPVINELEGNRIIEENVESNLVQIEAFVDTNEAQAVDAQVHLRPLNFVNSIESSADECLVSSSTELSREPNVILNSNNNNCNFLPLLDSTVDSTCDPNVYQSYNIEDEDNCSEISQTSENDESNLHELPFDSSIKSFKTTHRSSAALNAIPFATFSSPELNSDSSDDEYSGGNLAPSARFAMGQSILGHSSSSNYPNIDASQPGSSSLHLRENGNFDDSNSLALSDKMTKPHLMDEESVSSVDSLEGVASSLELGLVSGSNPVLGSSDAVARSTPLIPPEQILEQGHFTNKNSVGEIEDNREDYKMEKHVPDVSKRRLEFKESVVFETSSKPELSTLIPNSKLNDKNICAGVDSSSAFDYPMKSYTQDSKNGKTLNCIPELHSGSTLDDNRDQEKSRSEWIFHRTEASQSLDCRAYSSAPQSTEAAQNKICLSSPKKRLFASIDEISSSGKNNIAGSTKRFTSNANNFCFKPIRSEQQNITPVECLLSEESSQSLTKPNNKDLIVENTGVTCHSSAGVLSNSFISGRDELTDLFSIQHNNDILSVTENGLVNSPSLDCFSLTDPANKVHATFSGKYSTTSASTSVSGNINFYLPISSVDNNGNEHDIFISRIECPELTHETVENEQDNVFLSVLNNDESGVDSKSSAQTPCKESEIDGSLETPQKKLSDICGPCYFPNSSYDALQVSGSQVCLDLGGAEERFTSSGTVSATSLLSAGGSGLSVDGKDTSAGGNVLSAIGGDESHTKTSKLGKNRNYSQQAEYSELLKESSNVHLKEEGKVETPPGYQQSSSEGEKKKNYDWNFNLRRSQRSSTRHTSAQTSEVGRGITEGASIADRTVQCLAWASLPTTYLSIRLLSRTPDRRFYGVFAKQTLSQNTIFGPLIGVRQLSTEFDAQVELSSGLPRNVDTNSRAEGVASISTPDRLTFRITTESGEIFNIDASDPEHSNWMSLVRPAESYCKQNCSVVERDSNIYFVTNRTVPALEQLRVGYSEPYAQRYGFTVLQPSVEETRDDSNLWPCYECDSLLESSWELQQHLAIHEGREHVRRRRKGRIAGAVHKRRSISNKRAKLEGRSKVSTVRSTSAPEQGSLSELLTVMFRCSTCDQHFTDEQVLELHLQQHASCGVGFGNGKLGHPCSHCDKKMSPEHSDGENHRLSEKLLIYAPRNSVMKQQSESDFIKDFIDHAESQEGEVTRRSNTSKRNFTCPLCRLEVRTISQLRQHLPQHQDERGIFTCPNCKREFSTYKKVRTHIRAYCFQVIKCPLCEKNLPSMVKLRLHMATHTGRKDFECDQCSSCFSRKDKLQSHIRRVHENPSRRQIKYTNSAKNKKQMTEAQLYDSNQYFCRLCQIGFKRRGILANHTLSRHPNVPLSTVPDLCKPLPNAVLDYPCPHCHKVYRSNIRRKIHVLKSHPESELPSSNPRKPATNDDSFDAENLPSAVIAKNVPPRFAVSCLECKRQYATTAKLYQHYKKFHPGIEMSSVQEHVKLQKLQKSVNSEANGMKVNKDEEETVDNVKVNACEEQTTTYYINTNNVSTANMRTVCPVPEASTTYTIQAPSPSVALDNRYKSVVTSAVVGDKEGLSQVLDVIQLETNGMNVVTVRDLETPVNENVRMLETLNQPYTYIELPAVSSADLSSITRAKSQAQIFSEPSVSQDIRIMETIDMSVANAGENVDSNQSITLAFYNTETCKTYTVAVPFGQILHLAPNVVLVGTDNACAVNQ